MCSNLYQCHGARMVSWTLADLVLELGLFNYTCPRSKLNVVHIECLSSSFLGCSCLVLKPALFWPIGVWPHTFPYPQIGWFAHWWYLRSQLQLHEVICQLHSHRTEDVTRADVPPLSLAWSSSSLMDKVWHCTSKSWK